MKNILTQSVVVALTISTIMGCSSESPGINAARQTSAKPAAAKAQAATIAKTVILYVLDMGLSAPIDDFDLEVLLLTPDDGGGPQGPYLEHAADLVDPWGNPFEIMYEQCNRGFDIVSFGADGEPGGNGLDEDITQW